VNKQGNADNPRGGIEWTHVYGPGTGFTWNPISGCEHDCKWTMPDGKIAMCYAKAVAEKMRSETFFPNGFEQITFHPARLNEPVKKKDSSGIFLDSMSDLVGTNVPEEHILKVLDVVARCPQHTFQLLTKNAPRLLKFQERLRDLPNIWVGASTPPDFMYGKPLSQTQQEAMLRKTLEVLTQVGTRVRWLSAEPLSWNISPVLADYPGAINWIVIGAASDGPKYFPPNEQNLLNTLLEVDRQTIPVFFKGNMQCVSLIKSGEIAWRDAFPRTLKQGVLL